MIGRGEEPQIGPVLQEYRDLKTTGTMKEDSQNTPRIRPRRPTFLPKYLGDSSIRLQRHETLSPISNVVYQFLQT